MTEQSEAAREAILDLANQYERTHVAEYQGQLHVRVDRRVVAVFDYVEGTLRVNEVFNQAQRARVNEVLAIVGADRSLDYVEVEVEPGIVATAQRWTLADGTHEVVVPRTVFSMAALASPLDVEYDDPEQLTWVQDNPREVLDA